MSGQRVEVIYQSLKTVFEHISKHWEESWKYDEIRSIFDEFRGVWIVLRIHIVVSRTSSVFSALKFTHHWFSTACTQLLVLKYERVKFDFSGFHTNTWNCEMKRVINIFLLSQQFGEFCCYPAQGRSIFTYIFLLLIKLMLLSQLFFSLAS